MKLKEKILFLLIFSVFCSCNNTDDLIADEDISMPGLYEIDSSELGDWDNGFIQYIETEPEKSAYVLSKQINEEKVIYFNYLKGDISNGITIYVRENNRLGDILYKDILYTVEYTEETLTLYPRKEGETPIVISCTQLNIPITHSRAGGNAWWSAGELVTNIIGIFQNGEKLTNGDYANLIIALSTDQLISMLKLGAKGNVLTWIGIELANRGVFATLKAMYYNGSIPILEESRDGNKIYVTLAPNNIKDTETPVFLGLSILENPVVSDGIIRTPTYTNYDKRTSLVKVSSSKNRYEIVYEFPEVGNYDIVPFLIPQSIIQEFQTEFVREWFVQYGNVQSYSYPTIEVVNVEKELCGLISDDEVVFRLGVSIKIEEPEVLSNLGLKVVDSEYNNEIANTVKSVFTESNEIDLKVEGRLSIEKFDESGKTLLNLFPYSENGGKFVYGKVYGYNLSISEFCLDSHHPHMIDLGLPSGKMWSCCNVGASSPEQYGGYYAWGETEEKSVYDYDTYKYYNSNTGYINIGSNISGTQYDVAHVKWGNGWRMPTKDEIQELYNKCKFEGYTYNGVRGCKVTGPNGNSIFLPCAGNRVGTSLYGAGVFGFYWSGSLGEYGSYGAWGLYVRDDGYHYVYGSARGYGHSGRPVR